MHIFLCIFPSNPMYMSRKPFLALTDLSWVTNHSSYIADTRVNCLHLDLDFKDMWPNLIHTFIFQTASENIKELVE